jgi:hypothetical protein
LTFWRARPTLAGMANSVRFDGWFLFFLLVALGSLGNGVWMLVSPSGWYETLPAAVPDFGPLNEHFIRDLGCMFCTWGALAIWGAVSAAHRRFVLAVLASWYLMHAGVHVFDTATGRVGAEHWRIDFPATYVPAFLLAALAIFCRRGASER